MIHWSDPLTGIDERIFRQNQQLNDMLMARWEIQDDNQLQCFGRVSRNPTDKGYIPETYSGDSNYRDALLDDKYAVKVFWGMGDMAVDGIQNVQDVHTVLFVHLGVIKLGNPGRMDMEAREDVQRILGQNLFGYTLKGISLGERVLREYNGLRTGIQGQGDKFMDMQPYHMFRMEGTIRYDSPTFILN